MRKDIKLYFHMLRLNILSGMEYKGWWLTVVYTFLIMSAGIVSTFLLFSRFGSIGEWTLERVVLIYSIVVIGFGLAELFCRGFDSFPWQMIRSGEFDRVLLRPRTVPVQIAGSYFHLHRLSRVVTGLMTLIWALSRLETPMVFWRVLMLVLAVLGSFIMYSGVFVMTSGIAIFSVQALDWIFIVSNASHQLTRLPVPFMPGFLYRFFTFVLPMLAVSYYPASAMCGWGEPTWLGWLALPAGLLFMAVSYAVWRFGMRHYQSTGS